MKTGMICAVVGKAAAAQRELPVWFVTQRFHASFNFHKIVFKHEFFIIISFFLLRKSCRY